MAQRRQASPTACPRRMAPNDWFGQALVSTVQQQALEPANLSDAAKRRQRRSGAPSPPTLAAGSPISASTTHPASHPSPPSGPCRGGRTPPPATCQTRSRNGPLAAYVNRTSGVGRWGERPDRRVPFGTPMAPQGDAGQRPSPIRAGGAAAGNQLHLWRLKSGTQRSANGAFTGAATTV